MLTSTLLTLALFAQYGRNQPLYYSPIPPYVPVSEPYADYPVQVRILETRWSFDRGEYLGFGRGDILGPDHRGFDYTYSCGEPFKYNQLHGEFYEAKWKKQDQELEVLLQKVGSNHTARCTLKTSMKPESFSQGSATWLIAAPATPASATPTPPAPTPASSDPVLHRTPQ